MFLAPVLDTSQQDRYVTDELDSHGCRKLRQLTREDILDMFRARSACPELTVPPERVTWISHYRVNSRLSEHFGSGRVYLAGDACHCQGRLVLLRLDIGFLPFLLGYTSLSSKSI